MKKENELGLNLAYTQFRHLSTKEMPVTVLGIGDTVSNGTEEFCCHEIYSLERQHDKQSKTKQITM